MVLRTELVCLHSKHPSSCSSYLFLLQNTDHYTNPLLFINSELLLNTTIMRSAILLLSLYVLRAFSYVPQDDWLAPPNTPANQTRTTLTLGQQYTITWDSNLASWFSTFAPNTSVTDADLWITGYDLHQYQHLVASKSSKNLFQPCSCF